MISYKAIIATFLLFYIVGCRPIDIVGKYNQVSNSEFNTKLNIQENKGYSYEQRLGNVWVVSKGTWQLTGNSLSLTDTLEGNVLEVKQQFFLVRGQKLVEVPKHGQKAVTLRKQ